MLKVPIERCCHVYKRKRSDVYNICAISLSNEFLQRGWGCGKWFWKFRSVGGGYFSFKKWKFQRGREVLSEILSVVEVWIFSGTTQYTRTFVLLQNIIFSFFFSQEGKMILLPNFLANDMKLYDTSPSSWKGYRLPRNNFYFIYTNLSNLERKRILPRHMF